MQIISKSAKDTLGIGKRLAKYLRQGDIVCLFGDLGSGKTVLTKGIAKGLGVKKENVVSPSFVILRAYAKGKLPVYHFDLYRLGNLCSIQNLGYEEYLYGQGVTVIEWADRLKRLLPAEYLKIALSVRGISARSIKLSALGTHYKKLLEKIHADFRH